MLDERSAKTQKHNRNCYHWVFLMWRHSRVNLCKANLSRITKSMKIDPVVQQLPEPRIYRKRAGIIWPLNHSVVSVFPQTSKKSLLGILIEDNVITDHQSGPGGNANAGAACTIMQFYLPWNGNIISKRTYVQTKLLWAQKYYFQAKNEGQLILQAHEKYCL